MGNAALVQGFAIDRVFRRIGSTVKSAPEMRTSALRQKLQAS